MEMIEYSSVEIFAKRVFHRLDYTSTLFIVSSVLPKLLDSILYLLGSSIPHGINRKFLNCSERYHC